MSSAEDAYDDDALAAEYVLHLLDPSERAAFETRLTAEPALQARVHDWEARLAGLAEPLPETAPPAAIRARLMASLDPSGPTAPTGLATRLAGLRGRLLGGGLAAAALAAALLLAWPYVFAPDHDHPAFGAQLASADGALRLSAGVYPATHEIVLERQEGAPPAPGRVRQLWLIPEDGSPDGGAPISLGLLARDGATTIRVPDPIAPSVRPGTIAISDEPEGGSPTGAPTGPILATARFEDL